jgi:hypothetical protein
LAVLLLGALFVYSLAFSSFDQKVRFQWEVEADGSRTPRTHITCPSARRVKENVALTGIIP